ncbi:MAG: hypothetical protein LBG57_06360 [Treponema sp.]|jgi:hypothetical protein|nr:hypothetical protein [Treponema sp.]
MKKTFAKWGAAALALALVFAFASCAQPTEETSSGTATPTIIRLHLDKQGTTDFEGVIFEIRVAEELYVPNNYTNYPYGPVPGQNDDVTNRKNSANTINAVDFNDRKKVVAIPLTGIGVATPRSNDPAESVLQREGKKKILTSGYLLAADGVGAVGGSSQGSAPIQTDNDDKTQRYIDIELIDVRPSSPGYGSVYSGSIKGYIELAVSTNPAKTPLPLGAGVLEDTAYLYTENKHGFNEFLRLAEQADVDAGAALALGEPIYGVKNANIKTKSLKSGVNDLYLSFFSYQQNNQ